MDPTTEKLSLEGDVGQFEKREDDVFNDEDISNVSPEEAKRIMRKIDLRLITVTGLCYCISLLDRGNLGVAVVAGYVMSYS